MKALKGLRPRSGAKGLTALRRHRRARHIMACHPSPLRVAPDH
jgi:hypothetical protein